LLTHRQTDKLWQKHNLLGGGNNNSANMDACYTHNSLFISEIISSLHKKNERAWHDMDRLSWP